MKTACYTKSLTIAFPEETYLQIKQITDQGNISMGEWVRNAVEKDLAQENINPSEGGK